MQVVFIGALTLVLTSAVSADGWSQFRGGIGGQIVKVAHPIEWSSDENLAWSVPMKASGWSSPVVIGDQIFLTSASSEGISRPKGMSEGVASMRSFRSAKPVKHQYSVACHSLTDGALIWERTVGESVPRVIHPSNTYATESPATDGKHLFVFFATTGSLTAWDFEGNELWRRELGSYEAGNGFGTGSSLAVSDGHVFVQYDNDEQSFVVAIDVETGEDVWRDDRESKTSWSTPLLWTNRKQKELVTCGRGFVTSYDPMSGEILWKLNGMDSGFSGSPAIDVEQIYFGNSGPSSAGPLVAVKAGTSGEVELDSKFKHQALAWSRTKSGPGMASPVVSAGHLYIPSSGGILNCYATETGERAYRTRVPNMKTVVASLWADNQHVFILDEAGTTHVIRSGPEFEVLAANKIDDLFWSTPAVAGDVLLLRGVEKLYCIRK